MLPRRLLQLVPAVLVLVASPAPAAVHGGLAEAHQHHSGRVVGGKVSTVVLLVVPALLVASGTLVLRRPVRA